MPYFSARRWLSESNQHPAAYFHTPLLHTVTVPCSAYYILRCCVRINCTTLYVHVHLLCHTCEHVCHMYIYPVLCRLDNCTCAVPYCTACTYVYRSVPYGRIHLTVPYVHASVPNSVLDSSYTCKVRLPICASVRSPLDHTSKQPCTFFYMRFGPQLLGPYQQTHMCRCQPKL
jgi:hypothetical protein